MMKSMRKDRQKAAAQKGGDLKSRLPETRQLITWVVGAAALMALYWILENVTAIHYSTLRRQTQPEPAGAAD